MAGGRAGSNVELGPDCCARVTETSDTAQAPRERRNFIFNAAVLEPPLQLLVLKSDCPYALARREESKPKRMSETSDEHLKYEETLKGLDGSAVRGPEKEDRVVRQGHARFKKRIMG